MFKKILFTYLFVANAFMLIAQSHYPVQVQPLVITPSVYLQDYVDQNNLQVKVSLNDLSKQNFQIRLKMTISDGKTFLHTSANGIVLTLNGGQVYYLSDEDLATLFSPTDLGLQQSETLKEGMYSFSFEATTVFDNTVKVSNKSLDFTQTLVVLTDPPLLNMPIKDSELDLTQIGSSMQFAWMPRSFFTSPNRQVKYAIKIVKVDPIDLNPYQAIQSTQNNVILDLKGIDAPFLIYDPSMLMLETGAVYAWQIRAYEEVISNGEITQFGARFKNEGFSEVQTFSTKDVCPAIAIVAQPATGATPVVLSWTTGTGAGTPSQYEVQYREQGTTLPYTIVRTSENSITLDNTQIQEGLTYEYNVAVLCKKWQAPVYGGTFKLQKASCSPPSPIKIENPNVKGEMVLSWDLPAEQSLTAFKVTSNNGTDGDKETNIPVVDGTKSYSITLPVLTAGGYNIQIDGVCDQTNALGKKQFVAFNDNGFIGACPLPTPLTFYATRLKGDSARITFTNNQLHQSYVLKYWELSKGISKAITVNIPTAIPETKLLNIADNVLYQYQITFVCAGGKTTETGIGMFKIDPANNLDPNITPPTGNCFPPAQIAAEARSTTSAKFDWGKSKGADEYQLLYRVQGSTSNFQIFNTTASDAKLTGLVDSKIYEYKIKSRCGSAYSIESSLGTVDLSKPTINAKCDTIPFVRINKTTQTEIQLAWKFDDTLKRTGYTIFYKQDTQSWDDQYIEDFQDLKTFSKTNVSHDTAQFTIINLKPGTKYNFKIQATCGTDKAQANEVISGTTTQDKNANNCESGKACDRTSKTPVSSLKVGDVIGVADYNVKIKEVVAIDGSSPQAYKGTGTADAPFIGMSENLALNVSFDNLLVNDKMCSLKGDIKLDSASFYALDEKTREQAKGIVDFGRQVIDKTKEELAKDSAALHVADSITQLASDYTQGGGDVGKVIDGGIKEDYTTTLTSAPTADDAPNKPAIVKNAKGEVYQIDANGNVTKVGQYGTGYTNIEKQPINAIAGVKFSFKPNKAAKYPYDAFQKDYKKATFRTHYLRMDTTYCDAKLILPKELDKVDFEYTGDKTKLKFVNRKGFEYEIAGSTISLVGGPAADAQEIMAVYDDGTTKTVIGALLLASYEPKQKKVILVNTSISPTTTATQAEIQTELNKIYGPLGVNYTVTIDKNFVKNRAWYRIPGQKKIKDDDNTKIGNDYKGDAKSIIDAYIAQKGVDSLDKDAAYLFLVETETVSSAEAVDGKMHFKQQFGFLYNTLKTSAPTIAKTLAHELGHGNFNIYHAFDTLYLGKKATYGNNLMAYGNGTALNKLQWDQIHDPGVNWGLFVSDKNQQQSGIATFNILDPAGRVFSPTNPNGNDLIIISAVEYGPVLSFGYGLNSDIYQAEFNSTNEFVGYKKYKYSTANGVVKYTAFNPVVYYKQVFNYANNTGNEVQVFTVVKSTNTDYLWQAITLNKFVDPLSDGYTKLKITHFNNDPNDKINTDLYNVVTFGAIPTNTAGYNKQQAYLWDFALLKTEFKGGKNAGFVETDVTKIEYSSEKFNNESVNIIRCKASSFDFSKITYPAIKVNHLPGSSTKATLTTLINKDKTIVDPTKKPQTNLTLVTKDDEIIEYDNQNGYSARTITPFDKIPDGTNDVKSIVCIQNKTSKNYSILIPTAKKALLAKKYFNDASATSKISSFFTDYGLTIGNYFNNLAYAGNKTQEAWRELSDLLEGVTDQNVATTLSDYKCETIDAYRDGNYSVKPAKPSHYAAYYSYMLLGSMWVGEDEFGVNTPALNRKRAASAGIAVWNTLSKIPSGVVGSGAVVTSVLSTNQWKNARDFYDKNANLDKVAKWGAGIRNVLFQNGASLDDCEQAYNAGCVGGFVATIVLAPEDFLDKAIGLGMKAVKKISKLTVDVAGSTLKYGTTKTIQLFGDKIIIRWKGIDLTITDKSLIDDINKAIDNSNIDVNVTQGKEQGSLITTDASASLSKKLDDEASKWSDLQNLNNAGNAFRGITKTQFFETVAEFKIPSNGLFGDQAWDLWKAEKWTELETLFKNNNLNKSGTTIWPPNRGFIDVVPEPLTVGKEIDRYGGYIDNVDGLYKDKGTFASPKGASFESRALTPETINKPYVKYKVVKEIPGVNKGQAIPWFGQKGKGIQYELPESIDDLLKGGYIVKIRDSWNGYSKIFKASADEVLEATSKISKHRLTAGNGGNYGYLEGKVNNISVDSKFWRSTSITVAEREVHIFDAIIAQGTNGKEWLRITDSEYRMLNKLASDLGAVKGGKYPNITGELKIISENPYCSSCTGIIQQFNDMFPNVNLILIDGAK